MHVSILCSALSWHCLGCYQGGNCTRNNQAKFLKILFVLIKIKAALQKKTHVSIPIHFDSTDVVSSESCFVPRLIVSERSIGCHATLPLEGKLLCSLLSTPIHCLPLHRLYTFLYRRSEVFIALRIQATSAKALPYFLCGKHKSPLMYI